MHNHPSPFSSLSKQELEMILADQLYRNATAHANASTNALGAFTKICKSKFYCHHECMLTRTTEQQQLGQMRTKM